MRALRWEAGRAQRVWRRRTLQARPRAAPVTEESDRKEESDGERSEYYANLGKTIRTLREELPLAFEEDLSYDIYRDDVVLVDRVTLLGREQVSRGKQAYKRAFWSLRFHGAILFRRVNVSILRMWAPSDRTICVRWQVQGVPRLLSSFGAAAAVFDGISEFKLDSHGFIYEHRVDNVDWDVSHLRERLSVLQQFASLVPARAPHPNNSCDDQCNQ